MLQRQPTMIYVNQRHGPFRFPLTVLLALWAIAYPAILVLLAMLGPLGVLLGVGAGVVLFVPWVIGLAVIGFVRWFS